MSIRNINDLEYGPIVVRTADNTVHVGEKGAVIQGKIVDVPMEGAITEDSDHAADIHDNTYVIDGRLVDPASGLYTLGDRDDVKIGDTGKVFGGFYGVWLTGDASRLSNSGEISAGNQGYGVNVTENTGARIFNTGLITGDIAVGYYGEQGSIINGHHGIIAGDQLAIGVANLGTEATRVVNHGLIIGSSGVAAVFQGRAGSLVNDGTIKGDIYLNADVGIFDNRGGTVKGDIFGGLGNDTLVTDNAHYHLTEQPDHGTDTIRSTVSYTLDANIERLVFIGKADIVGLGTDGDNTLRGNDGMNTLSGLGGADILFGGKDNDILSGGDGGDTFVFATGSGRDTIADFLPGAGDFINLHGWTAIGNISQLLNHASDHGDNVWITAGNDTLVLEHFHKADLAPSSNEFLF